MVIFYDVLLPFKHQESAVMNLDILQPEVQEYLVAHATRKPADIALSKSPFSTVSSSELANQIGGYQRCMSKIPLWANTNNIYYPEKLNLEQCSSYQTAQYKCELITDASKLIDLTGGFGIDSFYYAQKANIVHYCEINPQLTPIVAHNFKVLGARNIEVHTGDSESIINAFPNNSLDYIYIDPSRRIKTQKVFLLSDCEPNVVALQDLYFTKANKIITKAAPLLDISAALQELKYVKEIHVVSVENDCKEIIFIQELGFQGSPQLHLQAFRKQGNYHVDFKWKAESEIGLKTSLPSNYLYEPDVVFTKAGAFKMVSSLFNIDKIHQHAHIYTSDTLIENFPGRQFKIEHVYPLNEFKKIGSKMKANIAAKNFPLKVEDIKKKFKMTDGGNNYLFFTTNAQNEHIVISCTKIN